MATLPWAGYLRVALTCLALLTLHSSLCTRSLLAAAPDHEGIEFFESKVRPILADNCYECHSRQSKRLRGELFLDTKAGVLKGGTTGPAIVAGDPEKSLLIKAVRYLNEDLQMPPKNKKLSPEKIAVLEQWVKMGAPDPRVASETIAKPTEIDKKAQSHWAFRPIKNPPVPKIKNERWVANSIDAFVLEKLESKGMQPSRRADARTLVRRASYNLTGLPPTPEEVAAFQKDPSPESYEKVIINYMSSPHYGERWARHWLDVARYADTKGYVFEEERRYPHAYTYRDYVINAFNDDLPFDKFIIQQLAADRLELGNDKRPLAALGYLTLGRRFLNNQADIIDDRIDVVARGMQGLTVGCARCHDHKYDPIPTADYYSWYGIFANSTEPSDRPLLGIPSDPTEFAAYQTERKQRLKELEDFRTTKDAEAIASLRLRAGEYLLTAYESQKIDDGSKTENLARQRKLSPSVTGRWKTSLEKWSKAGNPVMAPWFVFAAIGNTNFGGKEKDAVEKLAKLENANALVIKTLSSNPPTNIQQVADRYGELFAQAEKQWQALQTNYSSAKLLPDPALEQIRQILYAEDSPAIVSGDEIRRLLDVPSAQKLRALQRKLDELDATHPGAPPRAMALQDVPNPHDSRILIRGNIGNPGKEVPRQFLAVLAGKDRKPFTKGSGRLELAQAIISTNNPLTARVIVNRVWQYHFGVGLVKTPSDFGLRAEPPSHPELLDYLATWFVKEGWSIKKLNQLIMTSNTYQQSSDDNSQFAQLDPNNQFFWRFSRRRLEFEEMRDSLLAVSGKLDTKTGGHPVDITTAPYPARRAIYGFVERQNLPGMFRTFDFATPDVSSPQRFVTTVPQQALYLLNNGFVIDQARNLLARCDQRNPSTPARIDQMYQFAYQRPPSREELQWSIDFLKAQKTSAPIQPESPVWRYGYAQYNSASNSLTGFRSLPFYNGTSWQGSAKVPDTKTGWAMLNAQGGHPGNDHRHTVVRRWMSPVNAEIKISGSVKHDSTDGDGIEAMIFASGTGNLGHWTVKNQKKDATVDSLNIKIGDTVDFVVDCRESPNSDAFTWVPMIQIVKVSDGGSKPRRNEWNARTDFTGPAKAPLKPLNAWEKYAQALLVSDETFFVD